MTNFKQEHIDLGLVIITKDEKKCVLCRVPTKFYEPVNKVYICSVECYQNLSEVIYKANNNEF